MTAPSPFFRAFVKRIEDDADLALGLAEAYRELPFEERDAMLAILNEEVAGAACSPVAVFAPLFAVEEDVGRRAALYAHLRHLAPPTTEAFASDTQELFLLESFEGTFVSGTRIRFTGDALECDALPLSKRDALMRTLSQNLLAIPLSEAIDRLAAALVRWTRLLGMPVPPVLVRHAHLFGSSP
jgi:hypothetical protein